MASFTLTGLSSVVRTLNDDEMGFIGIDGSLVTNGVAVTGAAGTNALTVLGELYSYGGINSAVDANGSVFKMTVGAAGFVSAENPSRGALDWNLSGLGTLVNFGTIVAPYEEALDFRASDDGASVEVRNHGSISARSGEALALRPGMGSATVSNTGTIEAGFDAVYISVTSDSNASVHFSNTGKIISTRTDAASIGVGDHGTLTFVNSGVMQADDNVLDARGDGNVLARNTGQMIALTGDAIHLEGGNDEVTNTGTIIGDVHLGDGADIFESRTGTVKGTIYGENGNDVYHIGANSSRIAETNVAGGHDRVFSTVTHQLGQHFEELYLLNEGGEINGAGNSVNNLISGNNHANDLLGLSGNDSLYGDAGDDTLAGGTGDDRLVGGAGRDVINGGEGSDIAVYVSSQGWVNVSLLTGFVGGGDGSHAIGDSFVSIENLRGSGFDDRLNGDHGNNDLAGDAGNDILRGRGGADRLYGGSGEDTADYEDSPVFVNVSLLTGFAGGGNGSHAIGDTFLFMENLTGSAHNDLLNGDHGANVLQGRGGADTLNGNGGSDILSYEGSAGFVNVSLLSGFAGGGSGSHAIGDTWSNMEGLRGSSHNDILNGDHGANTIEGGAGDDTLRGNNGADTFIFANGFGDDVVADFADSSDKFNFANHSAINAFADLSVTASGGDAVIGDGLGNTITVTGAAGLIGATDFIF